jgi:glyoxylase I family protein
VDHLVAPPIERLAAAEILQGHPHSVGDPVPDEFKSEAWRIARRTLEMAKGTMNHLALTVRDLAKSEATFYAPVLGFLGYDKVEDIPGAMTLWFNADAKFAINLWQARPEGAARAHERYAPGFHHCAFDVDSRGDVDGLHRLLQKNDITVLDAPAEYPQYAPGYYAVYFEDADGLKFEVVHMPEIPT